jgi:hypothetical protein
MKYTNLHNLPEPLVNAIAGEKKFEKNRYSVTDLLKSPQELQLLRRHNDEITIDVSDGLWAVLGSSVHYILQKHSKTGLAEQYLTTDFEGCKIVGVADLYDEGLVTDWKVTSVYSFLLSDKDNWAKQLNIYAWLYKRSGMGVKDLRIYAILRDWQLSKTFADKDYPRIPFIEKKIDLMPMDFMESYIRERIRLHLEAEKVTDEQLPECTPEEKWARETTWAIMKKGAKKAVRVFEKEEYAKRVMESLDEKHYIEKRAGKNVKCTSYCNAKLKCFQYAKEIYK